MKDSYYPQEYKCSCERIVKRYIWSSEVKKAKHTCDCGKLLNFKNIYVELIESPIILGKMNNQQIKTDRKKRSTEHFKREILPTLPRKDRSHFEKKFKK